MNRFRTPPPIGPTVMVLCLLLASCIGGGSDDDTGEGPSTTESDSGGDESDTTTTTSAADDESDPATLLADLTDVAWVINSFDGLVDDRGRTIVASSAETLDNPRPSIVRAGDGSIYYVLGGRLWRRAIDTSEGTELDTGSEEIFGVAIDGEGNVILNPWGEATVVAENAAGQRDNSQIIESAGSITATNGITVRVLPPDVDVDDLGYVNEFRSPARLEVERDGAIEWTIHAGGVRSPWLGLVDFDGRRVMMARAPTEPADPMMQHIVYDLDCPSTDAAGSGCTRTFQALWGTASLVGPDREAGDTDLNTQLLDICPTQGIEIAPPAEMTDPDAFDDTFTGEDAEAFRLAALQLSTCDPTGLGDPDQPGLRYVAGGDDPDETGWMWTGFADSLRGPFTTADDGSRVWARHPDGPAAVLTAEFGDARIDFQPGRLIADPVAVTATADAVTATGRTDASTAEAIAAAAEAVADERGARFSNWIDATGAAPASDLADEFVATIEARLSDGAVGEIHLTADDVTGSPPGSTDPTTGERDLGFLLADYAAGGEGIYDELPLGDDVLMALGPQVLARRQPSELFRRSAWALNSTDFAGRVGPFNLLDLVPSPSRIVVGPHARCGGIEALPSPPELAGYTRIGILPADGSVDSCLDWSAVDVFVDDEGVIRGLSLHLSEP